MNKSKANLKKLQNIYRVELVSAHRAAAFYGLNEGVNNHITARIKLEESPDVMLMLPFGIQVTFFNLYFFIKYRLYYIVV